MCGFFFFQAEDGIRDYKVTGVQTCALPILAQGSIWVSQDVTERKRTEAELERIRREQQIVFDNSPGGGILLTRNRIIRSEERRVGKECRYLWRPYQGTKRCDGRTDAEEHAQ